MIGCFVVLVESLDPSRGAKPHVLGPYDTPEKARNVARAAREEGWQTGVALIAAGGGRDQSPRHEGEGPR